MTTTPTIRIGASIPRQELVILLKTAGADGNLDVERATTLMNSMSAEDVQWTWTAARNQPAVHAALMRVGNELQGIVEEETDREKELTQ